jgi:membrane protein
MSLLGVFGQGQSTVDSLLKIVDQIGPSSAVDTLRPTIERLSTSQGAGLALVLGLLGALWSASGYVGAFGRAMNRVYEIQEGRPIWKLRPLQLVVTLFSLVLVAVAAASLVLTGPVAKAVGDQIGLGSCGTSPSGPSCWPSWSSSSRSSTTRPRT